MKTILFTFALPLALCAAHGATAQTQGVMSAPKADTVMMSETTDGDYLVRKYVVKSSDDADYSVYYKISTWKLVPTFNGNTSELSGFDNLMANIDNDPLMHVESVTITGYASPDGPWSLNEKLAKGRAQSLKEYADQKFDLSKRYNVKINAVATNWNDAREAIAKSDVPDKEAVLKIIDSRDAAPAKESRLKAMPAVWKYLADNVLPHMRYSAIEVMYASGRVYEQRTIIPQPAPEPVCEDPCYDPCACVDVYESVSGIAVELEDVGVDF